MKTFYREEMTAAADSYSLSPLKPRVLVDWAIKEFQDEPISFEPATREQIALAHDRAYVDGVLDLEIANGFGSYSRKLADSLPYTVGSLIAAVRYAVEPQEGKKKVACSPTSGFHHAGHKYGGGFCTFNGLMVALLVAKEEGLIQTATILDGDMHWGDGTQDIIDKLGIDWITHWTGPRDSAINYHSSFGRACVAAESSDIVIYQAGADIHIDDPLGGVLRAGSMKRRDALISRLALRTPVVWNLAGGYQYNKSGRTIAEKLEPVMKLHKQTYSILRNSF